MCARARAVMTSLIRDVIADPVPSPEILLRLASNIALQFRRQFVNRSTISFGDGGEQLGIVFPANVVHHLFDGIDDHCLLALEATLGHFSGEVFLDVPRQVDGRTMVVSLPGYVNVPGPQYTGCAGSQRSAVEESANTPVANDRSSPAPLAEARVREIAIRHARDDRVPMHWHSPSAHRFT